jgi:hypothetical protein
MLKFTTKGKILIYLAAYLSMTIFPIIAYYVGWIGWDVYTGAKAALVMVIFWLVCSSAIFFIMADIPVIPASLPFILGLVYPFLPVTISGTLDDALVVAIGGVLSFVLWKRRKNVAPSWLLAPMLLTAVYTFFGAIIPTKIDEAIVYSFFFSLVIYGLLTNLAFHTLYTHVFSIILFMGKVFKKSCAQLSSAIVKKVPPNPTIETSEPLTFDEIENAEDVSVPASASQAQGMQA